MKEWAYKVALVAVAALAPIQAVIISVGLLVMADMVTGIWAAHKRGEAIKSAGLRRTVSKLIIYQIAIITGFIVEQYLVGSIVPLVKILGGVIGLVEFKSILENANAISGTDLFKLVIERLGSQNDIKKIVETKKEDK
jgi:hypothetical protein